jgi:hypothetical protein
LFWIRGEFLNSRKDFGKIVVHGHTPVEEPEVLPHWAAPMAEISGARCRFRHEADMPTAAANVRFAYGLTLVRLIASRAQKLAGCQNRSGPGRNSSECLLG